MSLEERGRDGSEFGRPLPTFEIPDSPCRADLSVALRLRAVAFG